VFSNLRGMLSRRRAGEDPYKGRGLARPLRLESLEFRVKRGREKRSMFVEKREKVKGGKKGGLP